MQQTPDNPQSKTLPRFTKCHCGRSFQEKPNSTHRVVPVPSDIQTEHSTLGTSSDRLICHQSKHETPNLCVFHSRPTGLGGGCTEHFQEEHNRLRFSSNSTITKSGSELLSQECRIILIALGWPTKPWFWDLVELSVDHPRQLPPIRSLLKQPLNKQFHTHPESLNLHAWYLGVQPSRTKVSLQKWPQQIELLHLKDTLLGPSTPQNGPFFNVGASNNRWTSGLPL